MDYCDYNDAPSGGSGFVVFSECLSFIAPVQGLAASLFLGGLVGSFVHCTPMCGPLVLAQTGAGRSGILVPYHLGRITTYTGMAVLFHSFVNLAGLFSPAKVVLTAFLLGFAALMFLVSALPGLAAVFPWAARVSVPIPTKILDRLARPLMVDPSGWRGYGLGLVLGFMPCGLVVAALMAASTADSAGQAAFAMLSFGAGTAPALVAIGCGGGWIKRKWPLQVRVVSSIVMAGSGLILFWLAARLVI